MKAEDILLVNIAREIFKGQLINGEETKKRKRVRKIPFFPRRKWRFTLISICCKIHRKAVPIVILTMVDWNSNKF